MGIFFAITIFWIMFFMLSTCTFWQKYISQRNLGSELLVHILFDVRVHYWSEFWMHDPKIECQKNSTINHRPIFFSPLCANWSYAISIYGSDILVWDIGIDTLWKWLALYHFLVDTVQNFSKFIFRKNSSNVTNALGAKYY